MSSSKEDDIYLSRLNVNQSVAIYKENDQWVMMAIGTDFELDGINVTSAVLAEGQLINIAGSEVLIESLGELKNGEAFDPGTAAKGGGQSKRDASAKEGAATGSNRLRLALIATLIAILIVFFMVIFVNKSSDSPDIARPGVGEETEIIIPVSPLSVDSVSQVRPENAVTSDDADLKRQEGAFEYYRRASNDYDLGFLKRAIEVIQEGLTQYPNDAILLKKLDDWQRNLYTELSRQYKNGCLHAKYFRNLEAKHAFSMVIQMSLNTNDLRYVEAQRLLSELQKNSMKKIECGGRSDVN